MSSSTPRESLPLSYAQKSPDHSLSPPAPSGSDSPSVVSLEPSPFARLSESHFRSASHTQSGSPPAVVRRASSATALPNLLNAEPPRSPVVPFGSHGSPGGLGALEALVQAATEERRRLSGEHPTPLEMKETARRASLSPVLNRVPPPLPGPLQSPVLQKSPALPSPRSDARVNSLAFISLGQAPHQDGEPPTKRRRRTGSFSVGSSSAIPPQAAAPVTTATVPSASVSTLAPPLALSPLPALSPKLAPASLPRSPPASVSALSSVPVHPELHTSSPGPTAPPVRESTSVATIPVATPTPAPSVTATYTPPPHPSSSPRLPSPSLAPTPNPPNPVSTTSAFSPRLSTPAQVLVEPPIPAAPKPRSISQLLVSDASLIGLSDEITISPPDFHNAPPDFKASQREPMATASEEILELPNESESTESTGTAVNLSAVNVIGAGSISTGSIKQEDVVKTEEELDGPIAASESHGHRVDVVNGVDESLDVRGARVASEPDAHEWLLEHYADNSPADVSRHTSPAPEEPPESPDSVRGSPLPEVKPEQVQVASISPSLPPSVAIERPKQTKASSRSPTPLALLEEELDRHSPINHHIPSIAVSPSSDADLAMELDLAASASIPTHAGAESSSNNELDDELLSLLDDEPKHLHIHSHPHSPIPHGHGHGHAQSHSHTSKTLQVGSSLAQRENSPLAREREGSVKKGSVIPASPVPPPTTTPAPSERVVMPPPIAPPAQAAKAVIQEQQPGPKPQKVETASASSSMKKKETATKPSQKTKQVAKPRAKVPTAKSKPKAVKDGAAGSTGRLTPSVSGSIAKGKKVTASGVAVASAAKRSVSAAVGQSRSRSASEMPAPAEPPSKAPQPEEPEEEEEEVIDDKLYCICKTSYDEDKVMIACDRCDEWYHTQCLNMNDLEVDLIDQFVCPPCIQAAPHLPLKTTYKQRCFAGLKHPRPSSAAACHKPARGAFSKFCSDECGINYMQRKIEGWGGDQAVLWASVRDVKQREGVVVKVHVVKEEPNGTLPSEQRPPAPGHLFTETFEVRQPTKTQRERAIARLQADLYKLAPKRETLKKELEVVLWRQKLLELATARAERVAECGWDQRLCFDDDEYAEYAIGVLESYEEDHGRASDVHDAMQVDSTGVDDGAWWCRGKKKCQRHAGWQKLRASEFEFDQELKEKAISALTTQERDIRRQLEDVMSLEIRKFHAPVAATPLQPLNGHTQTNGAGKIKANGKKGKQKN
ncbi:hypothetical protein C8Q79DRAFT_1005065 [Trametes meyenii]|nr:hypothetical protein C8Q79DRAFT_1005065 [Trametes meyenii]